MDTWEMIDLEKENCLTTRENASNQEELMHSVNETETSSSLDDFIFDPDEMTGIENEETDGVNTQTGDVHPWDTSMVDVNTGDLSMEEEEARKNMKRKLSELYSLDDSFEEHYDSVYIVDGSNQIV